MKIGAHELDDVLTTTLDVLLDIMQDEEANHRQRLDAAWTVAQLVAPRLMKRPERHDFPQALTNGPWLPDRVEAEA